LANFTERNKDMTTLPKGKDDVDHAVELDRRYLPRTIAGLFEISEQAIDNLTRKLDICHTGAGEIIGAKWLEYAKTHNIGLTDYGRSVAESRRAGTGGPHLQPAASTGPMTEAGKLAAALAQREADELATERTSMWLAYVAALEKIDRTPDDDEDLLSLARELGRLDKIDADQLIVSSAISALEKIAAGADRSQAAHDARLAYEETKKRHKVELEKSWKAMRLAESTAGEAFEARCALDVARSRHPEFFAVGDGLPRLPTLD
jgi:hypothetical protein